MEYTVYYDYSKFNSIKITMAEVEEGSGMFESSSKSVWNFKNTK